MLLLFFLFLYAFVIFVGYYVVKQKKKKKTATTKTRKKKSSENRAKTNKKRKQQNFSFLFAHFIDFCFKYWKYNSFSCWLNFFKDNSNNEMKWKKVISAGVFRRMLLSSCNSQVFAKIYLINAYTVLYFFIILLTARH